VYFFCFLLAIVSLVISSNRAGLLKSFEMTCDLHVTRSQSCWQRSVWCLYLLVMLSIFL